MNVPSKWWVCALAVSALCSSPPGVALQKGPPLARQVGEEENRQVADIVRVASATQKVSLLTEFLAARPDSVVRARLLTHVGIAISREPDAAVRVKLAESFAGLMITDSERSVAGAILADAYLKTNRADDAFQTVAVLPGADALDLRLLARLAAAGADLARQRNLKHLVVSRKYGDLALRAIEAERRPGGMNAATWAEYKRKTLPALYQSLGLLSLHGGSPADAREYFRKAVELAADDPLNHVYQGAAANEEYLAASQQLKQMAPGAARDALGRRTIALLEKVVDAYAHALALSAGTGQEQPIREQVWGDLENYYKFLHKGSLDGLQALIDGYKKQ